MKKKLLLLPMIIGLIYVLISSYSAGPANISGQDCTYAIGGNGCSGSGGCHGAATASTTVSIVLDSAGVAVNHYIAGQNYHIIVTGQNTSSTATLPKYGIQITAMKSTGAGTSSATDAGTFPASGYPSAVGPITVSGTHTIVEHSGRLNPSSGGGGTGTTYTCSIPWTAPATAGVGTVILYTSLNAINNNGSQSGDFWNNASDTIGEIIPGTVAPITGTFTICVGTSTTLSCTTTGGTWSSSNTAVATISSGGVVSGLTAGTTTISYTVGAFYSTVTFTVLSAASAGTLSGASSVCQGSSTPYTSTVGSGTWSSGTTSVATVNSSGMVFGVTAGTSVISYTVTTSCGTAISTKTITVNPNVTAGSLSGTAIVCVGTTVTFSSTVSGGVWTSSNPSIATISTTGVISGASVGGATITYTVTGACGTASQMRSITVNPAPSAGVISGNNFICLGSAITLTESLSTGTWSSSNPSVASISSSGVVTSASNGNTIISYSVTGICGTVVATHAIHVDTVAYAGYVAGSDSICIGIPVLIYDSLGAGGTWSSSNTSVATIDAAGYVTGLTAGHTTISYLIPPSGSCGTDTATRSITIFVGVPAIGGSTTTCVGQPDTLTNAVPSGLWSSSAPGIAMAAAGFGIIVGVTPGAATITYTSPAGCRVTTGFTVNRVPGPITGVLNVCPGATVTLSDTSLAGIWSSMDTNIAKISATGVVTGRAPATVDIHYRFPSTGCYATASFVVNPLPSFITGTFGFCVGTTDTLYDLTVGGTWASTPTAVASISPGSGILYANSAGYANITYTLPTGCYVTRQVLAHPLPVPTLNFDWWTNTFITEPYYVSYTWKKNGTIVTGATLNTLAGDDNASYSVTVVDTFGCSAVSTTYVLTNLAVHQLDYAVQIHMMPNPASDYVTIESPISVRAVVTSIEGKTVIDQPNAKTLDISSLNSGLYMVVFYDSNGDRLSVEKLIKN